MLHKLIDRSPALKKLRDEGFEVSIKGAHVLVGHVPYINSNKEISYGTLVADLTIAGDKAGRPRNHVIYFIGDQPCHKDGSIITALVHGQNKATLADGIEIDRSFSNKPPDGYADYYEKFTTYIDIISGPAQSIDNTVKVKTFKLIATEDSESPFHYPDTNSSRAQIASIADKLKGQRIGIVGLGGTGTYVLDFIAKTPVSEIHLFDNDEFLLHNAFRSPGAPTVEVLRETHPKVKYFAGLYSNMHRDITPHTEHITDSNLNKLAGLNFVFICIDQGGIKKTIINYLLYHSINFIDVGMGVELSDNGSLLGILRVTSSHNGKSDHIFKGRVSFADADVADLYTHNIQIAELNALNAALAVIKWKKMSGFFHDAEKEHNSLYTIDDNSIINENIDA
jgi:hypothetical protein